MAQQPRNQAWIIAVVVVAVFFGGWGLYEVGVSHGHNQSPQVGTQQASSAAAPVASTASTPASLDQAPSATAPATTVDAATGGDIVHATRTGKKYHRAGCRFLSKSDIPMTRQEAEAEGPHALRCVQALAPAGNFL